MITVITRAKRASRHRGPRTADVAGDRAQIVLPTLPALLTILLTSGEGRQGRGGATSIAAPCTSPTTNPHLGGLSLRSSPLRWRHAATRVRPPYLSAHIAHPAHPLALCAGSVSG